MTVKFGVVSHEVLDSGADALALHARDVADRDARCEERVFAEVFEVAAVQRSTIDVHPWPEHEMHSTGAGILTDGGSDSRCHRGIPGSCQPNAAEHGRRTVIAHANWAVGHLQSREADLIVGANIKIVHTTNNVNFLFEG